MIDPPLPLPCSDALTVSPLGEASGTYAGMEGIPFFEQLRDSQEVSLLQTPPHSNECRQSVGHQPVSECRIFTCLPYFLQASGNSSCKLNYGGCPSSLQLKLCEVHIIDPALYT